MDKRFKLPKIPIEPKKVALVVGAVILFFLVMDLNNRLNELSRLTEQENKAATVVNQLQSTLEVLQTQVAYASSEGAVEQWAYNEGHMARPGEKLIVPLSPAGTTPLAFVKETPVPTPVPNWQIWFALITGK
jgi:cell division protein FtsB